MRESSHAKDTPPHARPRPAVELRYFEDISGSQYFRKCASVARVTHAKCHTCHICIWAREDAIEKILLPEWCLRHIIAESLYFILLFIYDIEDIFLLMRRHDEIQDDVQNAKMHEKCLNENVKCRYTIKSEMMFLLIHWYIPKIYYTHKNNAPWNARHYYIIIYYERAHVIILLLRWYT